MKHEVTHHHVKLAVLKRQRLGRPGAELDFGVEPTSLGQHRLGEIETDRVSAPFRSRSRDQAGTSSTSRTRSPFVTLTWSSKGPIPSATSAPNPST